MKLLYLSIRNLGRNRRRTILTTTSIAASLLVFSVLMTMPEVLNRILSDRAGTLRIICHNKAGSLYSLPESYRRRIASIPHVEAVTGATLFGGTYRRPSDQFLNVAVDPENIDQMWPDWGISGASAEAFKRQRIACLAGKALIDRFRWRMGQRITLRGTIYPVNLELELVGTLSGKGPPVLLLFRRDYLEQAMHEPGRVNVFWVRVDRSASIPSAIGAIDAQFSNSADETQTESEEAYYSVTTRGYRVLADFAMMVAFLVVAAIGFMAANSAAMSVRERRGEIALMRALGFTNSAIVQSIATEGLAMGLSGAIIGCGAGFELTRAIGMSYAALGPIASALQVPLRVIVESVALGSALGVLAALAPALATVSGNVVEHIRIVN